MFKIVETIERGVKKLAIIPSAWERNGELAWPMFKADKLILMADSTPQDSWFRMRCKLKRNHLINYQVAEEELERMLEIDESADQVEAARMVDRKAKPRMLLPQRIRMYGGGDDFNTTAINACLRNDEMNINGHGHVKHEEIACPEESLLYDTAVADNSYAIMEEVSGITKNNQPFIDRDSASFFQTSDCNTFDTQLNKKMDVILINQTTIIKNQNQLMENQKLVGSKENQITIMQQLAKFEAMIGSLGTKLCHNVQDEAVTAEKVENTDDEVECIDCLEDLVKLEKKLENKSSMENLIQKLSFVCGRKGNGNGLNSCYLLVDILFTRKFMTICSWAGGARDQKEKVPFKTYKKVIHMFYRIVQLSDPSFTLKECEEFFKSVIRNSTRRSESNMTRSSTVKRRPKNLSYKKPKLCEKRTSEEDKNEISENNVTNQEEENTFKDPQAIESELASKVEN